MNGSPSAQKGVSRRTVLQASAIAGTAAAITTGFPMAARAGTYTIGNLLLYIGGFSNALLGEVHLDRIFAVKVP